MSIIPPDCLIRLARINCRKIQNILLMKIKVISVRECVGNLFIVQQITKKRIAREEETHMIFIDVEKEYGSVGMECSKFWKNIILIIALWESWRNYMRTVKHT